LLVQLARLGAQSGALPPVPGFAEFFPHAPRRTSAKQRLATNAVTTILARKAMPISHYATGESLRVELCNWTTRP
jgi:hypothetical protein